MFSCRSIRLSGTAVWKLKDILSVARSGNWTWNLFSDEPISGNTVNSVKGIVENHQVRKAQPFPFVVHSVLSVEAICPPPSSSPGDEGGSVHLLPPPSFLAEEHTRARGGDVGGIPPCTWSNLMY